MKGRNMIIVLAAAALLVSVGYILYMKKASQSIRLGYSPWRKLELVLEQIDANYVDEIDHKGMSETLISDALRALDPHSVYLPPKDRQAADEELQGEFDGIGLMFNVPADTAIVMSTVTGGPSEKAGLLSGDRIIRIDGDTVAGKGIPQDSLVSMMRGLAGTKVNLEVSRSGVDGLISFDITRDKIPVNSVDCAFMVNDTTGYVRLARFARTTYSEFITASSVLLDQGMTRMIVDLRDNLGGFLDQALLMGNEFLEAGDMIVYMEGRRRPKEEFRADGRGSLRNIRLDVLVNEASASSSEIFAGAIQDNDRGKIYGRRTFGKGLVQEPVYFSDGSAIRLTVAKFHTPSGRCIQKPYVPGGEEEYRHDIIDRYLSGEMLEADSIKVNDSLAFRTSGGRTVYGGGGIIPDVFVGIDTTSVNGFYVECSKRGLPVRFSSLMNDKYRAELSHIADFPALTDFMDSIGLERQFLAYAASQGVVPGPGEWEAMRGYLMTQVRALTGRYSSLDDEAFYRIFLDIDNIYQAALADREPISF